MPTRDAPGPRASLPVNAWAILGLLSSGTELTGYQLRQWAENVLGFFHSVPAMSQIYTELRRLERHGYVLGSEEEAPGGRARRSYRITPRDGPPWPAGSTRSRWSRPPCATGRCSGCGWAPTPRRSASGDPPRAPGPLRGDARRRRLPPGHRAGVPRASLRRPGRLLGGAALCRRAGHRRAGAGRTGPAGGRRPPPPPLPR
ncbi:PadR family transcriptional regulator [Nocardiopsis composta]